MIRFKHKHTKRIMTATCLLLLFIFTSLYATYQNGQDFNAAYASSSSSNCAELAAACAAAIAEAIEICFEYPDSDDCIAAIITVVLTCLKAMEACS